MPDILLDQLPRAPLVASNIVNARPRVMVVVGGGCPPRIAVAGALIDVCVVDYGALDRLSPGEHTSDLLHDTLDWKKHRPEPEAVGLLQDEIVGEFRAAGLDI